VKHKLAKLASGLLVTLAAMLFVPRFAVAAPSEYQVKAVFLFNFARFVEWPADAFASASTPFAVCILGRDPFGKDLDDVIKGETVNGRPLVVRRLQSTADATDCHILFISQSEDRRLGEVLSSVDRRSTLTVSDLPGAAQRGVMIRLVTERGRIRLRVNVETARAADLTISSNLLRSAEIVTSGNGGTG
jgi:hypothetical protein